MKKSILVATAVLVIQFAMIAAARWIGIGQLPSQAALLLRAPDGTVCSGKCLLGVVADSMSFEEGVKIIETHPLYQANPGEWERFESYSKPDSIYSLEAINWVSPDGPSLLLHRLPETPLVYAVILRVPIQPVDPSRSWIDFTMRDVIHVLGEPDYVLHGIYVQRPLTVLSWRYKGWTAFFEPTDFLSVRPEDRLVEVQVSAPQRFTIYPEMREWRGFADASRYVPDLVDPYMPRLP